jgi:hypothetical protein
VRDPTVTNLEVEAAIEAACESFFWFEGQEWFPQKKPVDAALHHEAYELTKRLPDMIMPVSVREYICEALSRSEKGLKRTYAAGRDRHIVQVVYEMARERGFPPTRNAAMRERERLGQPASQSACSIVTKALARLDVHMQERAIEDIWAARVR